LEAEPAAGAVGRLLAEQSIERLAKTLSVETPELAVATAAWMRSLSASEPADYFTHPEAFPMLLLPWWMEESITGAPDPAFQAEIAYSSVSGYYFVRLLDDLMDGEHPPPAPVLPAMIVLHTEFQQTYARLFAADHQFWQSFTRYSFDAAETASADAALDSVDLDQFTRISSRKIAGAKIPLAAVAHRHGRIDLLERWSAMVDLLGRWHQMRNDVQGWIVDSQHGRATYFLSEAGRRSVKGEPVPQWMAREGLSWATGLLEGWMNELLAAAAGLGSPPLVTYLEQRRDAAAAETQAVSADLAALSRLASALAPRRG
jgi:hypothetical protein